MGLITVLGFALAAGLTAIGGYAQPPAGQSAASSAGCSPGDVAPPRAVLAAYGAWGADGAPGRPAPRQASLRAGDPASASVGSSRALLRGVFAGSPASLSSSAGSLCEARSS